MLGLRGLSKATCSTSARGWTASRYGSSLVTQFDASVKDLPLREAVRYKGKNLKWTAKEFYGYAESHANALADYKHQPGDTVAVWLPDCAEKHVVLMSAAMLGLHIVDVDMDITSVAGVRAFLQAAKCKTMYLTPKYNEEDYLLLLRKAIPEFFEFDDSMGQVFHSKYFPTMRNFIHTGFDTENGAVTFKSLFLPHPPVNYAQKISASLPEDDPVYTHIANGSSEGTVKVTGPLTLTAAVSGSPNWDFARKLIAKEYFEGA